ncbi:MAG: asparagine synthetase B [Acidobacteriia bacterium]|nr:asparagine synthetase B [Terriglobia bacterium]
MSGFAGIVNFDGAPVDRALLEQLTHHQAFRGPDAEGLWCAGGVGFGHALLRTTREATREHQPLGLNDQLWIVADARLDARAELLAKLQARGAALSLSSPDVELILHAYHQWGEACVEHISGDFSFAIWDALNHKLFCARDHFGIRQLFYAQLGNTLIFSNTLSALRLIPGLSGRLNDLAIADFLLFDMIQDPAATSFEGIHRLPPANTLVAQRDKLSLQRYWELSVTAPVRYAREEEYVERFKELLDAAVSDRLRTDNAGILLSGGLDSPTVAASARRVLHRQGISGGLAASTHVFDTLIPHEERYYTGLVAKALQIPVEFSVLDHCRIFERADLPEAQASEPAHSAWPDTFPDQLRSLPEGCRVVLTGYGGDPALCGRISVHFRELLAAGEYRRAISDAFRYLTCEGRFSRLYLRTRWRIVFGSKNQASFYPPWLNEDLQKRLGLRERWEQLNQPVPAGPAVRPEAQQAMANPFWASALQVYDASCSRAPVEVRHPLFDLRLVNFLLGLPRMPWCSDKELFREAARGTLSDAVRLRRKSPLSADPLVALLEGPESAWVDQFVAAPELDPYVARPHIPKVINERNTWKAWIHLRPLSLNFWLRGLGK